MKKKYTKEKRIDLSLDNQIKDLFMDLLKNFIDEEELKDYSIKKISFEMELNDKNE